jgi:transcriptional regulator with XRE-family HTH domain
MTGSHTRWARPEAEPEDPERIAIREALAFGKAGYDRRVALGLSVADLADRVGMTADEIDCIEEGGTEPTIPLLRHLAAAPTPTSALPPATTLALSASKPTPPDPTHPSSSPCLQDAELLKPGIRVLWSHCPNVLDGPPRSADTGPARTTLSRCSPAISRHQVGGPCRGQSVGSVLGPFPPSGAVHQRPQ